MNGLSRLLAVCAALTPLLALADVDVGLMEPPKLGDAVLPLTVCASSLLIFALRMKFDKTPNPRRRSLWFQAGLATALTLSMLVATCHEHIDDTAITDGFFLTGWIGTFIMFPFEVVLIVWNAIKRDFQTIGYRFLILLMLASFFTMGLTSNS